jgi:hypothetical protein
MKHKLIIASDGDDNIKIMLDGETMGNFNHDEHGWSGMEAATTLASAIAKKLNIEVIHADMEDSEE